MDTQGQNLSEIFNPFFEGGFLFWDSFFGTDFHVLGSILSQPVPVPGRDKIIPKKPKAHNHKKGKQRNQTKRTTTTRDRRKKTETEKQEKGKQNKRRKGQEKEKKEIPRSPNYR